MEKYFNHFFANIGYGALVIALAIYSFLALFVIMNGEWQPIILIPTAILAYLVGYYLNPKNKNDET